MASNMNTRRYVKNWIERHGPQTRTGLIDGLKMAFAHDMVEDIANDLFREEYLSADNDGMIRWVG